MSAITASMQTVRDWLVGTYTSREQAMAQPVWFIPVRLWYVAVDGLFDEGIGFFTEQANEHDPDRIYRSRVLQLLEEPLRFENYRLIDQDRWLGAATDPEHLARLRRSDCEPLPGCAIYLERQGDAFRGRMKPGGACRLRSADTSYIEIELELREGVFLTLDRGFDSATGEQTWGSLGGPYRYIKQSP
ncbi:chromophore lyase CpcT/CpeT [Gloeobacter kilaueensis]|uniref:Chromophore lyase CpcT/CpeT n=1 Tax=Gloeobacter kilaueensis (strain ATCC BAA-2537 / CCAP 1431/1 / ULC 316 / JS1) TaxID=1183438 RepID=U5QG33_GLOK1|nr:chromophore lyase CpcT/CpeT [Gloeobacter kilaueensis]AGY57813.1 hypothetical protein GKIL_1567 [Gloeobacter kilaueensis JS1]